MENLLMRASNVARDAQKILDLDIGLGKAIDEVAIVCGTPKLLEQFVADAEILHGATHFNSVKNDHMRRRAGIMRRRGFDVRFEFLRLPERSWRIEAMTVLSGHAPLHSQWQEKYGDPCVVHASFKCESLEEYDEMKDRLRAGGEALPFKAEYSNSYGIFSYWECGYYFLKPRVNLRDSR